MSTANELLFSPPSKENGETREEEEEVLIGLWRHHVSEDGDSGEEEEAAPRPRGRPPREKQTEPRRVGRAQGKVKGDEVKDTSSIAGKDAMRPWK